jgi:hypothetical protein
MPRLTGLNIRGDFGVPFTPDDHMAAKAEFDKLVGHGYFAFATKPGNDAEIIREFDPAAEEIVMVRQFVGG